MEATQEPQNIDVKGLKPSFLGKLAYYLIPIRRSIVLSNMNLVFGKSLTQAEIKKLAQCYYTHMMRLIIENIGMAFMSNAQMQKRIEVIGIETAMEESRKNKGTLFFTGHFGNWEMGSLAAVIKHDHFKNRFHLVRRDISNKFIEKIAFRRCYKAGLRVIPKRNSLNLVLDALDHNDAVVFIMDQYAKPGKDGILVDFFGKPAGTFKSLAMVAKRMGSPVIPSVTYRKPDGTHVMEFKQALPWINHPDPDQEILLNTRQYSRAIEKMVLDHPDQWMWMHRRWKVKKK